jgi:hypothetical protein
MATKVNTETVAAWADIMTRAPSEEAPAPEKDRYWRECAEAMSRMAVIVAARLERLSDIWHMSADEVALRYGEHDEGLAQLRCCNESLGGYRTNIAVLVARLDEITKDPTSLPIDAERALKEYEQS